MAKTNKQAIIDLCKKINSKEGQGSIISLGNDKGLKIPRWSTGLEDLDNIVGGGFPEGRIIEIFGAESSGKTSLGYHLMSRHELALDIPIEGCVDCDTEYFNGSEWKKISEYKQGEKVLQCGKNGVAFLKEPKKYVIYDSKYLWHVKSQRLDMCVSEYHNIPYFSVGKNHSKKIKIKPFHEIRLAIQNNKNGFCGNINIPKVFKFSGSGIDLSEQQIRLMVAVFADGHFRTKSTQCYIGLKKQRKIDRLKMLLNWNGIEYRIKGGFFIFYAPFREKHYPAEWYNMSKEQFEIVIDEMQYWYGCQFEKGHAPSFCTVHKKDADFIQFAYIILGYPAYITTRDRRNEIKFIGDRQIKTERVCYNVCSGIKSNFASLRKAKITKYKTKDDKMYCFTTDTGLWIMRRNDSIIVTGNTFEAERAKVFGNKPKQMLVYRARYGEQALNKAVQFAQQGIPLIVIDSVPACKPREDLDKLLKQVNSEQENTERMGGTARLMHRYLPVLEEICESTGTTVVLINQVRDKMDALLFGEKTDTPGGRAPKFYSSIRIQVARRAWIEIPNKDVSNSAQNKKVGMIMKCKVIKSKVSNPMGECEIPLFFDRGFVSFDDVAEIRKELMKKNKIRKEEKE